MLPPAPHPTLGLDLPTSEDTFLRIARFAYEMGAARSRPRSWQSELNQPMANVAEHTYRVCFLSMMLAVQEGADPARTAMIAMVHDTDEIRAMDLTPQQKAYVTIDGDKAVSDTFSGTPLEDVCLPLFKEYKEKTSLEARCVKDADILDTIFELTEIAGRGSQYLEAIQERIIIKRDLLKTPSAKALYDVLAGGRVSPWDWFLKGPSTFKDGTYGR